MSKKKKNKVVLYINDKVRKAFSSIKRFKVVYGGRDSGKSTMVVLWFVLLSFKDRYRFLNIKKTARTIRDSVYSLYEEVIKKNNLESYFTFTQTSIKNNVTGSEFLFTGLLPSAERIKSVNKINYCFIEEASELTQDDWDIVIPTIREPGNKIFIVFNPADGTEPVYKTFIDNTPENAEVVKINYDDNPFLSDESKDYIEYLKEVDWEKYKHIYEGEKLLISDKVIFKNKYEVRHFETPNDAVFYHGMDWGGGGAAQDPSVAVRCFIDDNTLYIDKESYLTGAAADLDNMPDHLIADIPTSYKWQILSDTNFPNSIKYLRNRGFNIKPVKKMKIIDGINFLKSFEKIIIHPDCENTAYEFMTYSWKTDKMSGDIIPEPEDKHNHCIDTVRYSLSNVFHQGSKINLKEEDMIRLSRSIAGKNRRVAALPQVPR